MPDDEKEQEGPSELDTLIAEARAKFAKCKTVRALETAWGKLEDRIRNIGGEADVLALYNVRHEAIISNATTE